MRTKRAPGITANTAIRTIRRVRCCRRMAASSAARRACAPSFFRCRFGVRDAGVLMRAGTLAMRPSVPCSHPTVRMATVTLRREPPGRRRTTPQRHPPDAAGSNHAE